MGFPGVQLTGYSVRQILFNVGAQVETARALYESLGPDAMFQVMDLSVEANALGLPVRYPLHESPSVEDHPVRSVDDLNQFAKIDILKDGRVTAFVQAMRGMKEAIGVRAVDTSSARSRWPDGSWGSRKQRCALSTTRHRLSRYSSSQPTG